MRIGRNDPCPCGSGKKYKKCCQRLDDTAHASRTAAGHVRAAAASAASWEADVVPLPVGIKGDPAARLAFSLVVADGFVIGTDALNRPSAEPEAIAAILADALVDAGRRVGALPERVLVREPEVAQALAERLRSHPSARELGGLPAVEAGALGDLDEAAYAAIEHAGGSGRSRASCPETWAAWGLPEEIVAALFARAAAFYRAAPWERLPSSDDALEALMPAGNRWSLSVLGAAGEEHGIALYSEAEDFHALLDSLSVENAFDDFRGRVLSVTFDDLREQSRAARRELTAAGWEVAGPGAYPRVLALNTPAGGLRRSDVADLEALLAAVPRFVAACAADLAEGTAIEGWRDEPTGIEMSWQPIDDDIELEPPPLTPGGAEGPGADPASAVDGQTAAMADLEAFVKRQLAVVERFARHLREEQALSAATAARHGENASAFVEFLAGNGIPAPAVHEYDLRVFLFDWYPRKGWDGITRAKAMPVSLQRFFAFLATKEGIICPWAANVLDNRAAIQDRWIDAPTGPFWDEEVMAWRAEHDDELMARLMLPDSGLGDEAEQRWGPTMGPTEARLDRELHRRWLLWREELLAEGCDDWGELAGKLVQRQRLWERTAHPDLDGMSPIDAIREERSRHGGEQLSFPFR